MCQPQTAGSVKFNLPHVVKASGGGSSDNDCEVVGFVLVLEVAVLLLERTEGDFRIDEDDVDDVDDDDDDVGLCDNSEVPLPRRLFLERTMASESTTRGDSIDDDDIDRRYSAVSAGEK